MAATPSDTWAASAWPCNRTVSKAKEDVTSFRFGGGGWGELVVLSSRKTSLGFSGREDCPPECAAAADGVYQNGQVPPVPFSISKVCLGDGEGSVLPQVL